MNNRFVSIIYRKIHFSILIVVFILLAFYVMLSGEMIMNYLLRITSFAKLGNYYLTILFVFSIGFFLLFYFEFRHNITSLNRFNQQHVVQKNELRELDRKIPSNLVGSILYQNIRNLCDEFWNKGDVHNYYKYLNLQKDVISYIIRMNKKDSVVSWREERLYINKILELVALCYDTKNYKLELFEPTANYRFPAGLFIIPFFNAIEYSIQHKDSSLKIECFNVAGLWNCQISNYILPKTNSRDYFRCRGFAYVQHKIDVGNWSIRLDRIPVEQGMITVIVGKHVC